MPAKPEQPKVDTSEILITFIMSINWEDKISNTEVLKRADMTEIEAMIIKAQLRWSGHLVRMLDNILSKKLFCSELAEGKRVADDQYKRYRDSFKVSLEKCDIQFSTWRDKTKNPGSCRASERTMAQSTSSQSEVEIPRQTSYEKIILNSGPITGIHPMFNV